ncbi:MAG: sigma-54 dependent transcriptional regulator [Pseudomonadota bacterium]
MEQQQHESVAPVLVAHTHAEVQQDLEHRIQFLGYDTVTLRELRDTQGDERAVTAIVADESHYTRLADVPGTSLRELLLSTPVLMLDESNTNRYASGSAPLWPVSVPLRRARLAHLLTQATRYRGRQRRQRLTGSSASIARVRHSIEQVAAFDTNVLVSGESGTGKELVARTIHDLSDRRDAPFVPVNCGAIPEDLLESELFGHEKGAFTGAVNTRKGRFELAEGGTIFLDEIGDMAMPMQVKLLRVLQERSFERVGSSTTLSANVRIIAATHRDLPRSVAAGEFREDLFYRLNVYPIAMPPLRKRLEDIPGLLRELVNGYDMTSGKTLRLQPCALAALAQYRWPGNVRELGNLVERLAILHPTGVVRLSDLPAKYCGEITHDQTGDSVEQLPEHGIVLKDHLRQLERSLIDTALERSGGVVAKAARLLQIRRTTLVEKLRVA